MFDNWIKVISRVYPVTDQLAREIQHLKALKMNIDSCACLFSLDFSLNGYYRNSRTYR